MDQDGDETGGEVPDDQYIAAFGIIAPRITGHVPDGQIVPPLDYLQITFNQPMDPNSFSLVDDIPSFTGPQNPILTGFSWIDAQTLQIQFEPLRVSGSYQMTVGPQILDLGGNPMDQDGDEVGGEVPDDQYTAGFSLPYSGSLTEDTSWDAEMGTIVIGGTLTVPVGITLTIEPGTVVKAADSSVGINIHGELNALGTPDQPIIITSPRDDDVGGDTNGDGDATSPNPGDWVGIVVTGTGKVTIDNAVIRYASTGINANYSYAQVELTNVIISNNSQYGIYTYSPYVDIDATNCVIANNGLPGIFQRADSKGVYRNCTIVGNGFGGSGSNGAGIHIGAATMECENCIIAFNANGINHSGADESQTTVGNSCFYNPSGQNIIWTSGGAQPQLDQDGNITTNPLFVDETADNYELDAGSPAIDSAHGNSSIFYDILGRLRYDDLGMPNVGTGVLWYADMGAYERQDDTAVADNLAVTHVGSPAPLVVEPNDTFNIQWRVTNVGTLDCTGTWQDVIYMSDDPYISPDDLVLDTRDPNGPLAPGDGYTDSLTMTVPDVTGPKYILVHANANRSLEDPDETNNIGVPADVLAVSVPLLELDIPMAGILTPGNWDYFRFDANMVSSVRLTLDAETTSGFTGLYVRYAVPPTASEYDAAGNINSQPDQGAMLLEPMNGTYFVGIYGHELPGGPTNYTLLAELPELSILSVSPSLVSNSGNATFAITGENFDPNATVQIFRPEEIFDGEVHYQDPSTLYATFEMATLGVTPGDYDVIVTNADLTSDSYSSVTVEAEGMADFSASLSMPGVARPGRNITVPVQYSNTGTADLFSPLLTITGPDDCQYQLPGSEEWITGPKLRFLALSSTDPANILRPGQSETIKISVLVPLRPGTLHLSLTSLGAHPGDGSELAIDWDSMEAASRLDTVPDAVWEPFWNTLVNSIGETWIDAIHSLGDEAAAWDHRYRQAYLFDWLFKQKVNQASAGDAPVSDYTCDPDPSGYGPGPATIPYALEVNGECTATLFSGPPDSARAYLIKETLERENRANRTNWEFEVINDNQEIGDLGVLDFGIKEEDGSAKAFLRADLVKSPAYQGDFVQNIWVSSIAASDFCETAQQRPGIETNHNRVLNLFHDCEDVFHKIDRIDDPCDNLTPTIFKAYLNELSGADEDDIAVFYYSGHGFDGSGGFPIHLNDRGACLGIVEPSEFTQALANLHYNHNVGRILFIADMCHAQSTMDTSYEWLSYALSSDANSISFTPANGGVFTNTLFDALENQIPPMPRYTNLDANNDGKVSVFEAFNYSRFINDHYKRIIERFKNVNLSKDGYDTILLDDHYPFNWIQVIETNLPGSADHTIRYVDTQGNWPFCWSETEIDSRCHVNGPLEYCDSASRPPTADGVTWRAYYILAKWDGGRKVKLYPNHQWEWGFDISKPEETVDPNDVPDGDDEDEDDTDIYTSYTPEDKIGPAGSDVPGTLEGSKLRYIAAGKTLDYRIEFWNKEDAPVPTQYAIVEDVLDPNVFDLNTFEFTRIGFLKWDQSLSGVQIIQTRIDCRPDLGLAVDITGNFDSQTGRIFWEFKCVDPLTGDWPADPMTGFLPPFNAETGYEIGWVEFRVKPRPDLPPCTQIANQAFVEFDFAGDLYDHPAPKEGPWINTIAHPLDLSVNGTVDFADLALLGDLWHWEGPAGSIPEDIHPDGRIDFSDIAGLLDSWLTGLQCE